MKDILILIFILLIGLFIINNIRIAVNKRHNEYVLSPNSSLFDNVIQIKSANLPISNQAIKDRLSDKKLTRKEYDEILSIFHKERAEVLTERLLND